MAVGYYLIQACPKCFAWNKQMPPKNHREPLTIGDVVELNSGGIKMTVDGVSEAGVNCVWLDGGKVRQKLFAPALLRCEDEITVIERIERRIVYAADEIDAILAEVKGCPGAQDESDTVSISLDTLRRILTSHLGPA